MWYKISDGEFINLNECARIIYIDYSNIESYGIEFELGKSTARQCFSNVTDRTNAMKQIEKLLFPQPKLTKKRGNNEQVDK